MKPSAELNLIKQELQRSQPRTVGETMFAIQVYFNGLTWSILKEEWEKMSFLERQRLAEKLFKELK